MSTLDCHLNGQNTLEIISQQDRISSQTSQKYKNKENSQNCSLKKLSVKGYQQTKLIKKIQSLTEQNRKLKQISTKMFQQVKSKLLKIETDFLKKQLNLQGHFQNLQKDLKIKSELIDSMKEKINFLSKQNIYLKQQREEMFQFLPQTIMEFFNTQNANILLSEKNIKKWFKVLEQNLVEKIKLDLNEKYKQEKEPRLTFATSDNVDPKSKNSIPSLDQVNKSDKNNHQKSFFNSELSQVNESKFLQQKNECLQNIDSSFVLTQSKESIMNKQNQLYFQKTLQFKFQGNANKNRVKNQRLFDKSQNELKLPENQNQKINRIHNKKERPSHKSDLNLLKNIKSIEIFPKLSLNQQDDQNKTTTKKLSFIKNTNFNWNIEKEANKKQSQNQKMLHFQSNGQNQYIFKNQLLKEYNKVLENTHQKYKNKSVLSNTFGQINMQLTPKRLYFK